MLPGVQQDLEVGDALVEQLLLRPERIVLTGQDPFVTVGQSVQNRLKLCPQALVGKGKQLLNGVLVVAIGVAELLLVELQRRPAADRNAHLIEPS